MDLTTQYLGLTLKNPLVPSASPLSRSVEMAREMEDAGASAIIMYSLFEEAVTADTENSARFLSHQSTGFAEAETFLPDFHDYEHGLDVYLNNLRRQIFLSAYSLQYLPLMLIIPSLFKEPSTFKLFTFLPFSPEVVCIY